MTLIEELSNQFIPIVVIVAFGWYISHFAKATIPRLFLVTFGLYFAILGKTEFDHLIGLGLALPHIKFFFTWIIDTFHEFKRGTIDIYYSFLTIFYKTRNVFLRAYRFFSRKKSSQKSTGSNYYHKQEYRQYEDFGQSSKQKNKKEHRQEQQKQGDTYSNYEEPSYEQTYKEEKIEDDIPSEHKRFFSSSYYEVLGVSPDEDFASIKKKFRNLQREYHPDLNIDQTEQYTKISQNLNQAYEYFEKIHK